MASNGSRRFGGLVLAILILAGCSRVGSSGGPTAEPLASPTPDALSSPVGTDVVVASSEPSDEPTTEPTSEPTPEATEEPTPEPIPSDWSCPTESPITVLDLNYAGRKCFGDNEIRVRAWLDLGPVMGWLPPVIEPGWLVYPNARHGVRAFALWSKEPRDNDIVLCDPLCQFQWIHLPPDSDLEVRDPGRWVTAIGHVNDPAAERCHWDYAQGQDHEQDEADALATCRNSFVVDALEDID